MDTIKDKRDLSQGIMEIIAGSGALVLGTVLVIKGGKGAIDCALGTLPIGLTFIGDGIRRIRKVHGPHVEEGGIVFLTDKNPYPNIKDYDKNDCPNLSVYDTNPYRAVYIGDRKSA